VFAYTGQVLASMCVVGPKHRMTPQKLLAVRTPLAVLSRRLSERLGFNAAAATSSSDGFRDPALLGGVPASP
jgi:hypothetical protein